MNKRRLAKAIKRIKLLPINRFLLFYIKNKIRHFYLKLIKSTSVAYPSTIMLELTNNCNLRCTICPREYNYGKEMDKGNMMIGQAMAVIDEVWPYLDSIGLTGMGETFLYNDIEEIVDYIKAKNRGIIISVSTNAVLPNFISKATRLVNKIDTIQVSIDGVDGVYEEIRKGASFKFFEENLKKLIALCANSQTTLMLNMVVTKENYTQMAVLVEYASKLGVKYIDYTLFNLAAVTDIETDYYKFYQSVDFKNQLDKLNTAITCFPNVVVTNKNFQTHNSFQKCPFPWSHFYITWDGFLVPCCAKPFPKEMSFGNVFGNSFIDLLNSPSYKSFRQLWFKNQSPNFCRKCHFINIEPVR